MGAGFLAHPVIWILGAVLGAAWLSRLFAVALHMRRIPETDECGVRRAAGRCSGPCAASEHHRSGPQRSRTHRSCTSSLLELDYPDYEVIAVDDRSDDATGAIMDRLQAEVARARGGAASSAEGRTYHRASRGLAGQDPCDVAGREAGYRGLVVVYRRRCRVSRGRIAAGDGLCRAGARRSCCVVPDDGDGVGWRAHDDGVLSVAICVRAPAVEGGRSQVARRR